jgi:hypothetical protein
VKEDDSQLGDSKFSGNSSDNSINLLPRICVTNLDGIGGRPGPRIKADDMPADGNDKLGPVKCS